VPLLPIAQVASVRVLNDYINETRTTEALCFGPRLSLIHPHQWGVQNEPVIHAEIKRDLKGLNRVVATIRVARIVSLAHSTN
jgi:hypothetical protein